MKVELIVASQEKSEEWNSIVDSSPHGTLFHTWKWLKIAEKFSGSKLYPLVGYKGKETLGILPIFFIKKAHLKMVFSPPPSLALYYLGPVLANIDVIPHHRAEKNLGDLIREANSFIESELKANYTSISLPPDQMDPRPFKWTGYAVEPAYDYQVDISAGQDILFQQLPKNMRHNLNRAVNRGISVEEGGKAELEAVVDMMTERYREQGKVVTVSKNYLFEVFDAYKSNIKIFVAKHEGAIISGVIDVIYRDEVLSWIGNPKPNIHSLPSPNDLLIWEEIKSGCNNGMRQYITLSAAGNERLHTYYSSKLNPALKVRFSVKKSSPIINLLEKSYSELVKPLYSKMKLSDA
jgi:lipid II:glycine glycyltransferase (peptidoglycan interpeptide bridge formation enzyme)